MHGRVSIIGGHVPGLPLKVYAYALYTVACRAKVPPGAVI